MEDGTEYTSEKHVIRAFIPFLVSIALVFSGFGVLLDLQTSIHIKNGVGATATCASYIASAIFGVTFTPIILRKFEKKYLMQITASTCLIYIAANYYPVSSVLIPAGVIVGFGEALMWPVMSLYVTYFATKFAQFGAKNTSDVITEFTGYFFCSYQLSQTFGNLVSYAILYAGKTITDTGGNAFNKSAVVDLSICGVNDCQYKNVTNANMKQYVPHSKIVLYIMFAVMGFFVLSAIAIITIFLNKINSSLQAQNEIKDQFMGATMAAMLKHMVNPKQLLITPFALYSGLYMAFKFSELPRAYSSCMLGVTQVGLCIAISDTSNALVSYFSCKLISRIGRVGPIVVVFLLDFGNYMFLLNWVPTSSNKWLVYVIFAIFGCIDGVWNPQINDIHGSHFPENKETAFMVWNFWILVGFAIQFGWSTSLCVYLKIYVQIGLLCFSVVCYGIAEYRFVKEKKNAYEPIK
uniref:Protein unc-93 homolog A n=1 Tax=Ciona intestinalis TaxID=7719 RepID=F6Z5A7_CIOIN